MLIMFLSAVSLDSLLKVALESSIYGEILKNRRLSVQAMEYQAGRFPNPEIFSSFSTDEVVAGVSQSITNPLLLSLQKDLWKNDMQKAQLWEERERFYFLLRLKREYIRAVISTLRIRTLEESIDTLEEFMRKVEEGYERGKFPYSHVLNLKARLEHLQGELSLERLRFRNYLIQLSVLSGIEVDSIVSSLPSVEMPSEERLLSMLRSSFVAAEKGISIKEMELRRRYASVSVFSQLNMELAYRREFPNNRLVELGVSFPLPLWNFNRGEVRYYEYMKRAIVNDSAFTLGLLSSEILSLREEFQVLKNRLSIIRKSEIPLLERAYENSKLMYMRGGGSYLEVVDAFEKLIQKKMEELDYTIRMYDICFRIEEILGRCLRKEEEK